MVKNIEVDMTHGPIFKKIFFFSVPLIFTNVLQILFNSADILILGIFVNDRAVAAVGATSALINLIVGMFVGLSVGANVTVARYLGKNNVDSVRKTVGMSMLLSVLLGFVLIFVGIFGAKTFLTWMSCDINVLDMATKYLKIYFIGMPVMMLYNFCASILRAAGETVRPLIFLAIGGILNIFLNIFFILVFHKDVEGVAIATVVSQAFSAIMCVVLLAKNSGAVKLQRKFIRFYKEELVGLIRIGVPAGIQGCLFSLSNVIIQSSVNSFGEIVMAGNSYAQQFEAMVYQSMNGIALAALSFVGQNYGAGKFGRIKRVTYECILTVILVGVVIGGILAIFAPQLVGLISKEEKTIMVAAKRMAIISSLYFLCGIMDVYSYSLRGLGKSTAAMVITLFGTCVFRVIWVYSFLAVIDEVYIIYWAYPITWVLTGLVLALYYHVTLNKLRIAYIENEGAGLEGDTLSSEDLSESDDKIDCKNECGEEKSIQDEFKDDAVNNIII